MKTKTCILVFAAAFSATQAHAQFGGRSRHGGTDGRGQQERSADNVGEGGQATGQNYLLDETQRELSEAQEKLKIRPDQQGEWDTFAERVGALVVDQLRPPPPPPDRKVSAVQRIDRKVDLVRDRLTAMEDIADAAKRLYGKLDAAQRADADLWLPAAVPELYSGLWQRPAKLEAGKRGPATPGRDRGAGDSGQGGPRD